MCFKSREFKHLEAFPGQEINEYISCPTSGW